MGENEQVQRQAHVVIVPTPGLGHLIPLAELAKLLVSRFNISATLLLQSRANDQPCEAQSLYLASLPDYVSYDFLPPVDLSHLPENVSHDVTMSLIPVHSVPYIRSSLTSMAKRFNLVAFVTDLFGTAFFEVARELNVPPYMYFTCNAMYLLFMLNLPRLDETMSCEFRDMASPLVLPGCIPLECEDIEDSLQDRKGEAYEWNLRHVKRYVLAEGILVNTFRDLEPASLQALKAGRPNWPPVYPVGPIVRSILGDEDEEGSRCLRWLDQQPTKSVLYVSFGSGGTLSSEQFNELAIGLERSGHRFLSVVRSPNDQSSYGSYFGVNGENDPFDFLPNKFVDRTKDRGLLVRSWAPQVKVLSHGSTAGFLTHCGWNSILESIIHGVPLIAWPLYAEQNTNAALLHRGLKVALRPEFNRHKGLVEADQVANVVKNLLEGEEGHNIRNRIEKLSNQAQSASEDNGDSTKSLDEVALTWSF